MALAIEPNRNGRSGNAHYRQNGKVAPAIGNALVLIEGLGIIVAGFIGIRYQNFFFRKLEILEVEQVHHRAEPGERAQMGHHATKHRQIDHLDGGIGQHRHKIEHRIHHQHRETVAGQQRADGGDAIEENKLQCCRQIPVKRQEPIVLQVEHHKQRRHGIGHDAKEQTRHPVSGKPAFPAVGHGVQAVAQLCVIQVAKEQIGADGGVNDVHHAKGNDEALHIISGIAVIILVRTHFHQDQHHTDQVQRPDGSKAEDILFQRHALTTRCF